MKLCLAATSSREIFRPDVETIPFLLESFYYFKPWQEEAIKKAKLFVADSGAFSYMSGKQLGDVSKFTKDYVDFLKKYKVKNYMEMDVDSLFGLEKVEYLRKYMEDALGYASIPVFHKSRGLEYWHKMCEEYKYVAIGTMQEYKGKPDVLKGLVSIAHQKKAKVHGLGFTGRDVKQYGFYSADSSTWLSGGRYGRLAQFNGREIIELPKKDRRAKDYKEIDRHNLIEWKKYQAYLARNDID